MAPKIPATTIHPILSTLKLTGKLNVDYEFFETKSDDAGTAYEIRFFDDKKATKARLNNLAMMNGKRIVISCYSGPVNENKELEELKPAEPSMGSY